MVKNGSREALVKVYFVPGVDNSLSVDFVSDKRPLANPDEYFKFSNMKRTIRLSNLDYDYQGLGTFFNSSLSFNSA